LTTKTKLLLSAIGVCTAAAWISLRFEIPLLQRLPGWFWKLHDTPFENPLPLVGVTLLGGAVVWHVLRHPKRLTVCAIDS
jgi:hypothetical protein